MLGFKAGGSPSPSIPMSWRRIGKAKSHRVRGNVPKIQISRLGPMEIFAICCGLIASVYVVKGFIALYRFSKG